MRLEFYLTALGVAVLTFALSITSLVLPNWVKFHVSSPFDLTTTYGLWSKCDDNPWSNSLPQPSLSPSSPLNITTTTTSGPGSFTCRPFPSREQDCTNRRLAQIVSKFIARNVVGGSFVGREDVKGTEGDEVEVREARGRLEGQEWGLCESWLTARYAATMSTVFGAFAILNILIISLRGRVYRENGWKSVVGWMGLHGSMQLIAMSLIAHEFNDDNRFFYASRLDVSFILTTIAWSLDFLMIFALVLVGSIGMIREDEYVPIEG